MKDVHIIPLVLCLFNHSSAVWHSLGSALPLAAGFAAALSAAVWLEQLSLGCAWPGTSETRQRAQPVLPYSVNTVISSRIFILMKHKLGFQ